MGGDNWQFREIGAGLNLFDDVLGDSNLKGKSPGPFGVTGATTGGTVDLEELVKQAHTTLSQMGVKFSQQTLLAAAKSAWAQVKKGLG